MKKSIFIFFSLIQFCLPTHAVLKEKDIDNTLSVLRTELTTFHSELERQSGFMREQQEAIRKNLFGVLNRSNQNSLMLYSQKTGYIFDLTYACHEATEQYQEFQRNVMPFRTYLEKANADIARYDSLIVNLSNMPTMALSERAKTDRSVCLALAVNIRRTLKDNREQLNDYIGYYENTERQLKSLNDYANKRYLDIQTSIFNIRGEHYFNILRNLGSNLRDTRQTVMKKYMTYDQGVRSDWDVRVILFLFVALFIYSLVSFVIASVVIRYLLPKRLRTEGFMAKRMCIIMTASVVLLAIILGVIRATVEQNFLIMASKLLVQYTWLLGVILISLLLRLDGSQIKSAFRIYAPLIFMGLLVIVFRIVLIPNDLVNLILPPSLLICMLWQWYVIRRHKHNIPRSDVFYTYVSLFVFIASVVCSWMGYTLASVQLLILWIMQLTCILTLTCISGWLKSYAKRRELDSKPITDTWFFHFLYTVALPVLGVFSVLFSFYWATDVFNLSDAARHIFNKKFIESKNFTLSFMSIALVVSLFFLFKYINRTLQSFVRLYFEKSDLSTAATRSLMVKNVIQLVVWGAWLLISLSIMRVNNTWLVVVSGGLSTGIGFAMKDIIENIYYGISLMAGRIKVGDWIVCDGTRGRVSSISYTSTMLEAIDGSVIAFTNSQLLLKNYKNLTKNHGYELVVLDVGVAYGTDFARCRQLLIDAIKELHVTDPRKEPNVLLKEFGDNSVNLKIVVWLPVITQALDQSRILECVYNTLAANNIEIPFPQRDLHIINPQNLIEHGAEKETTTHI
ncbi:MAG: mechanosensitive ion channel [Prevotella sp.]|nr:mechanosensitive ion channel [Prevotella sp.]